MMFSALTFGAALVLSLVWQANLRRILALAVLSRILVPPQAVGVDFVAIHPCWLVVAAAGLVFLLCQTPRAWRAVAATWPLALLAVVLIGYGMLNAVIGHAGYAVAFGVLLQIVVLPYVIVLILWDECRTATSVRPFAAVMIIGAVAEVVLGQMQLNEQRAIFWEAEYATSWFWTPGAIGRAMGTLGHGLQLGTLCAMAVPFLRYLRWVPLRLALIPVLLYGTVIGSARTALVIASVLALVILVQAWQESPASAGLATVFIVPAAAAAISAQSQVVADMVGKLTGEDGASTQLRVDAADWFFAHYGSFLVMGSPMNGDLRTDGYLRSSLENGYFMVALLFGVGFAGLYTVFVVAGMLAGMRDVRANLVIVLAIAGSLVSFAASGAFMSGSVDGVVLWVLTGIAMGHASRSAVPGVARAARAAQLSSGLPQWRVVARGWG